MLVRRKHVAYTSSSYTTVHWQGYIDNSVECGEQYVPTWSSIFIIASHPLTIRSVAV